MNYIQGPFCYYYYVLKVKTTSLQKGKAQTA